VSELLVIIFLREHDGVHRLAALGRQLDPLLDDDAWLDCMLVGYLDSHAVRGVFGPIPEAERSHCYRNSLFVYLEQPWTRHDASNICHIS
jgi:hypothetical protein